MNKKSIIYIIIAIIALIAIIGVSAYYFGFFNETTDFDNAFMRGTFQGQVVENPLSKELNKSDFKNWSASYTNNESNITYNMSCVKDGQFMLDLYQLQGLQAPEVRKLGDNEWKIYYSQAVPTTGNESNVTSNQTIDVYICTAERDDATYIINIMSYDKVQCDGSLYCELYEDHIEPLLKSISLKDGSDAPEMYEVLNVTKDDYKQLKDYIEQVISPYDNDYDKLKAIEEMLSTYHYTTNPVELDREHFMDDFLLDKKEGYCTYFATAFTLISRYLGLPARYVQGYVVTFDGKTADVLKENAHAWPEVYFEGVGWVPFEPTPTFYNERYVSHSKGIQKGTTNNYYQSYYGNNQNIQEPNLDNIDVSQSQKKLPAKKIGYAALLLLLLIAFTYVLSGIIRKTRYRKMNDNEKVIYILQMVIMFLSFIGLQTMEGETLQEFFHRNTDNNLNNRLNQILCIYQEVRYKQIPPTAEQLVLMREAGNDIYFMIFKKIKKRAIILRFTVYDFSFSKKHRRIL